MEDKVRLASRLDALGIHYIEGGWPGSNPKDLRFFRRMQDVNLKHAKLAAFSMTRRAGGAAANDANMQALVSAGAPVATIVGKSWDFHVTAALDTTRDENLAMIADTIAYLRPKMDEVVFDAEHFFDGLAADRDYALACVRAAADAGATLVCLCDTRGGSLPAAIGAGVDAARAAIPTALGIHCHNDCELAVANSVTAIERGCVQVQGTINGIGERCGNVDLVSVIANLALKRGYEVLRPGSLARLTEGSRYVYETANMNFLSTQPFVGTSAFAHKGGMHAHGIARTTASYEHIDPASVGNERRVLISELSGQSSILAKTSGLRGLTPPAQDQALMSKILGRVQDLEHEGYEFEAAEASFDLLVRKTAGLYQPKFERLAYRVNIETEGRDLPRTEATVKVRVGDQIMHTVSEGDGPVNALDGALRKALQPIFSNLAQMSLVDYKVRVVNARAGTAARVRVVIESRDQADVWGTVGVSENIIEASLQALVDSMEYALLKK